MAEPYCYAPRFIKIRYGFQCKGDVVQGKRI